MNLILFEQTEIDHDLQINLLAADTRAVHLKNILKAETGTIFEAGVVNGKRGKAVINSITAGNIEVTFKPEIEPSGLHPVTLILGLSRPPTVRKVLKEATALGICRFILCRTENGERSYLQSSGLKPEKLHELFIEGAQQAFCTMLPEAELCGSLKKAVELTVSKNTGAHLLALDNIEAVMPLSEYWKQQSGRKNLPSRLVIAVGSERGWTDTERNALKTAGYTLCSLGERVLRTETASIAGAAICLSGMGLI